LNVCNVEEDDMMKGLLALSLAGALVAPQLTQASESKLEGEGRRNIAFSVALPLPPIPYLDTMPWISLGLERGPRIDTLLLPGLHPDSSAVANLKQDSPSRANAE
jgi:hypothetical protein